MTLAYKGLRDDTLKMKLENITSFFCTPLAIGFESRGLEVSYGLGFHWTVIIMRICSLIMCLFYRLLGLFLLWERERIVSFLGQSSKFPTFCVQVILVSCGGWMISSFMGMRICFLS
jgi:hypothetical protein